MSPFFVPIVLYKSHIYTHIIMHIWINLNNLDSDSSRGHNKGGQQRYVIMGTLNDLYDIILKLYQSYKYI